MLAANRPAKFLVPFAQDDAGRTEIPATSVDATRFSQSLGSPPLTGLPLEAGGVPPQLPDFNGAMNQIARGVWWAIGGGRFPFDGTWSADPLIGGYARGAVLPAALGGNTVGMGEWYNNVDSNTANPDTVGTGWVPGYHYGATILSAQTGGTVTLTPAQAGKTVIRVSGTLTSNLVLVVPGWVYQWAVYNETAGAFTVTVKNAATPGVNVPQDGQPADIRCDGTACTRVVVTVPNASTTTAGITRLATVGEVAAATSDAIAVTPAGMAQTKAIAWTTGLQAALNAKAPVASPAFTGNATSTGSFIGTGGFQYGCSITVKDHAYDLAPAAGLAQVLALEPVAYRYKGQPDLRLGYYAEAVREIIPEAVQDAPEDCFSPLLLEDAQMLPAHTLAVQQLHAMLQDALTRIEELEARP